MGKRVSEYMRDISRILVTEDTSMTDVVRIMLDQDSRSIVVTDVNRALQGIITGSDILREIEKSLNSTALLTGVAAHVMTPRPFSLPSTALMLEAVDTMFRYRLRVLIITERYSPVGLLTQIDVMQWWRDEQGNGT